MNYYLYQLKFDSPVHFGCAELGGKLEQMGMEYPADTLFSALCCELAQQGEIGLLEELYAKALRGAIAFSDLFPYQFEQGDCHFYLPKPVIAAEAAAMGAKEELQAVRQEAALQKKQKKMHYLRASHMKDYMAALTGGRPYAEEYHFGMMALTERVNCRQDEPLPYYVGQFTFQEGTGLYGLLKLEDDRDALRLARLIQSLGESGIGGKRSSGYGKFHLEDDMLSLDAAGIYEDDGAIYHLLTSTEAAWQMALSATLPGPEEIEAVKRGDYTLRKRSGFVTTAAEVTKRDSVYMLAAGSCLRERISGMVCTLPQRKAHPVYRYGKGFFVGL